MPYQVVWEPACFEELDEMLRWGVPTWMLADAVRKIGEALAVAPLDVGEELAEELRKYDVAPLRAYFYIETLDGLVKVTSLRLIEE